MGDDLDILPESVLFGIICCIIGLCIGAALLGYMAAH